MKLKDMRKAYDKAIKKMLEAESVLQYFSSFIKFEGFGEFEPKVGFISEGCILISMDGEDGELLELSAEDAINLMETKGCITPDDF